MENFDKVIIEKSIDETLHFFSKEKSLSEQKIAIAKGYKKIISGEYVMSITLIIVGVIVSIYGLADLIPSVILPGGIIMLITGPVLLFSSILILKDAIKKSFSKIEINFETDISKLCEKFYSLMLTKKEILDKEDTNKMLHFISLPVYQNYEYAQWTVYEHNITYLAQKGESLQCRYCNKSVKNVKRSNFSILMKKHFSWEQEKLQSNELQKITKDQYYVCMSCGRAVICADCMHNHPDDILSYLCPVCGRGTNGFNGLKKRWNQIIFHYGKLSSFNENEFIKISSFKVEQTPTETDNLFSVKTTISGKPFGSISFLNSAFVNNGQVFLTTPEPIVITG